MRTAKVTLALLAGIFLCCGCGGTNNSQSSQGIQTTPGSSVTAADDAQIIQAQNDRLERVELTVAAPIEKLLRDEDYRLPHQRFLLLLSNGTTVLVANDLKYGTFVPAQAGDMVRIHGEYIWNERGGVLHWTHHSDEPNHQGGWIDFNGRRYQ